jgi:hypothetical protein
VKCARCACAGAGVAEIVAEARREGARGWVSCSKNALSPAPKREDAEEKKEGYKKR